MAEDLFFWENKNGQLDSVNYDWRNRKRRQDIPKQYIENGSFYLFKPEVLKQNNNRFGKKIGVVEMEFWKMFEIDSMDDLRMCSALMKEFIIK
jgi:N-acylneuraminate cytidylyltransferase